jgi:hypothetical protein
LPIQWTYEQTHCLEISATKSWPCRFTFGNILASRIIDIKRYKCGQKDIFIGNSVTYQVNISIKDPDMNPPSYAHLIFDKGTKNTLWRKDSLFTKCCWKNWISECRKLKLEPCLSPYTGSNSKWIKEMQIKTTLKFHLAPVRTATIKNTNNNKCW